MGQIENYWDGITIYSVEFVSKTKDGTKRKHRKILVFNSSVSKEDVFSFVPIYLNNIEEVLHVDEINDGLYLKA